jgi:hypothetical protein
MKRTNSYILRDSVKLEYLPYTTYSASKLVAKYEGHDDFYKAASLTEAFLLGVELCDGATLDASIEGFVEWFNGRSSDVDQNIEDYLNTVDVDLMPEMFRAWQNTRQRLTPITSVLLEGDPGNTNPEDKGNGGTL